MVEILFEYLCNVPYLQDELYLEIHTFFEYCNSIPSTGFEKFWKSTSSENIRNVQAALLIQLERYYKRNAKEHLPGNMIRLEMCLMICVNSEFQGSIQHGPNGARLFNDFQIRLTQIILQIFLEMSAKFDVNNEYFIKKLSEFMSLPNQREVLAYVINVY